MVDVSAWPVVPGYFVTTPMYMVRTCATATVVFCALTPLLFASDCRKSCEYDHRGCERVGDDERSQRYVHVAHRGGFAVSGDLPHSGRY